MLVQNEKRLHGERHSAFSSELNSEMIQNPVNAHQGVAYRRKNLLHALLAVGFLSSGPSTSFSEIDKENYEAQQAYRAYVKAWRLKETYEIAAARRIPTGLQ